MKKPLNKSGFFLTVFTYDVQTVESGSCLCMT